MAALIAVSADAQMQIDIAPTGQFNDMSAVRASMKKLESQSDLYGDYIEDGMKGCHSTKQAALAGYQYKDEDGTEHEYVEVVMCNGAVDVLGEYDADKATVTVPANQYCYTIDENSSLYSSYGECKFVFLSVTFSAEGTPKAFDDADFVFDINDDGSLTMQNEGYYIYIDGGNYDKKYYSYGSDIWLYPVNSHQTYNRYASKKWQEYESNTYVEDYETSVSVYNFVGYGMIDIYINDDLSVSMATGQPLLKNTSGDTSVYGEYINLVGCDISTGKVLTDYDVTEIPGTLSGNTISFDGQYFTGVTLTDESEKAYTIGTFKKYVLTLDTGNFLADGIKQVSGTREEQIRNTRTYNLMGQQVDRDTAKGLLIRGGKKYIKR